MPTNRPQKEDVVIHRQVHSPAVYVLGRFDGAPQITHKTYASALEEAIRFAVKTGVDVWYTIDEEAFRCVAQHRSPL